MALHMNGAVYTGLQLSKPVPGPSATMCGEVLISISFVSHLCCVGCMASLSTDITSNFLTIGCMYTIQM